MKKYFQHVKGALAPSPGPLESLLITYRRRVFVIITITVAVVHADYCSLLCRYRCAMLLPARRRQNAVARLTGCPFLLIQRLQPSLRAA